MPRSLPQLILLLATVLLAACAPRGAQRFPVAAAYHLEAAGKAESAAALLAAPAAFTIPQTPDMRVDYTGSGFWARARVAAPDARKTWYLVFDEPTFNEVDLYVTDGARILSHERAGSFVPVAERSVKKPYVAFRVELPAGAERTLLVRMASYNIIDPTMSLYDEEALVGQEDVEVMLQGWYYGGAAAMLLFNLLLFLSIRERSYLFYAAFLFGTSWTLFTFDGLSDVYLGGITSGWQRYTAAIAQFALMWAVCFSRSFLRLPLQLPGMDRWLNRLCWANFAALLLALSPWQVASGFATDVLCVVTGTAVIVAGVKAYRIGFRPARFYLLSWMALFSMNLVWLGKMYGVLPRNAFTVHGMLVGSMIEMVLMSLGLGDRIKMIAEESERARQTARESAAVTRAMQMLAHDLKKPYSLLDTTLSVLAAEADPTRLRAMAGERTRAVRDAAAYVEGMLDEVMSVGLEVRLAKAPCEPDELIGRALRTARLPDGVQVSTRFKHDAAVAAHADERKLVRVLVNILENAAQAMGGRGRLWIKTEDAGTRGHRRLLLVIGNDGPLIAPADRERLFDPFFTKGKKGGTGLGLAVARNIIQAHGGQITCTSAAGLGTEFRMTLPVVAAAPRVTIAAARADFPAAALPAAAAVLPAPRPAASAPPGAGAATFAVVDDCPFIREAWQTLAGPGETVRAFANPDELLAALAAEPALRLALAATVTDADFGGEATAASCFDLARALAGICPVYLSTDLGALSAEELAPFAARVPKHPVPLAELVKA